MTDLTTGQRIAQCRKNQNLSQEALGEKIGVSRQAVSKWEADAVMPDIDKLIGLSKLFQVSVGWLLGVEELQPEAPEAPGEPQVSEELLRKIEQIVLRYQPQKRRFSRKKKVCLVLAALALLWLGFWGLDSWQNQRNTVQYTSSQVSSIRGQTSQIQNQLDALTQRLDDLSLTMEQAAASLASYEFTLIPDLENQTVQVAVDIVPKTWNEGNTAFLSIRKDGEEVQSQACHWDGTALSAQPQLPMEDGFAYWLVIHSPQGNQESIPLLNEPAQRLHRSFNIVFHAEAQPTSYENGTLRVSFDNFYLSRPEPETDPEQWEWRSVYFVLTVERGGEPVGYATAYAKEEYMADQFIEQWGHAPLEFTILDHREVFWADATEILELKFGDILALSMCAGLKNDVTYDAYLGKWAYEDGNFRPLE